MPKAAVLSSVFVVLCIGGVSSPHSLPPWAAEYFAIPPVEVEGVLSFYAQFKRVKPGKYQIAVCDGTACHIKGAPLVHEWLKQELGLNPGETDADGIFSEAQKMYDVTQQLHLWIRNKYPTLYIAYCTERKQSIYVNKLINFLIYYVFNNFLVLIDKMLLLSNTTFNITSFDLNSSIIY